MTASNIRSITTLVDETEEELPQALPIGLVLGAKYEIKRLLGMGGNGAVYEGQHTTVGHRVAIKVVHQRLANREGTLARFNREARICGSLRHPNVGQVYDVGTLDDGSPYMVMELQEGRSLGDVLDEAKLPIAAVIEIVCQLLAGLAAAHRAGSIHRDVKADNVMIVRDHSGEVLVKLVDFGISKSIKSRDRERSVTGEGIIIGSPDYMPPEQLRGDEVDVRTDLYSTGVLLYEAITGRLPFDAESLAELVVRILRDPVIPPSALRDDCPAELERIVLKAMSRDPADRYRTAEEMSRALAEVRAVMRNSPAPNLTNLSDPPPRPSGATRVHRRRTIDAHTLEGIRVETRSIMRPQSRTRWIVVALGGATGVLALAWMLMFTASRAREQVREAPLAVSPATKANTTAPPPMAKSVPQGGDERQPSTTPPPAVPIAVEIDVPTEPVRSMSSSHRKPSQTKPGVRVAAIVDEKAEGVQALLKQAATSFALGQTAEALSLYQRIAKSSPREANAWRGLGVAASRLGDQTKAVRAFQRYLKLRPNAPDAVRVQQQLDKLR